MCNFPPPPAHSCGPQTNCAEQTVAVANHLAHLEPALAHQTCRILVCRRDPCVRCLCRSRSRSRAHRPRRVTQVRLVSASHSLTSFFPFSQNPLFCLAHRPILSLGNVCVCVWQKVDEGGRGVGPGVCHQTEWRRSTVPTLGSRRAVGVAASQESSMRR